MRRVAAIFDLDDTLLTDSSGRLMFRYLRQRRLLRRFFHPWGVLTVLNAVSLYKLRVIDATRAMQRTAHLARDVRVAELWEIVQSWFDEMLVHAIAAEGQARVNWHRSQGHIPVICSAASQFSVQPVARHLDVDHVVCTEWLAEDGKLTGIVREPIVYGEGKVFWMERWAQRHNVDLASSYFYSDHISDQPLLQRVAYPTVVNPNRKFGRLATRFGWPIQYWT